MASVFARKPRVFCAHCGEMVSQRTFYAHKKEYYDHVSSTWKKRVRRDPTELKATPEVRIDDEAANDDDSVDTGITDGASTIHMNLDFDPTQESEQIMDVLPCNASSNPEPDEMVSGGDKVDQGECPEIVSEFWETDSDSSDCPDELEAASTHTSASLVEDSTHIRSSNLTVKWFLLLLLTWQSAFTVSSQAIGTLLMIFKRVLVFISRATTSPLLKVLVSVFPGSLYMAYKFLGIKQSFDVYAVCGRCHSIYDTNTENTTDSTGRLAKRCTFLAFPEHRMSYHRVPCHGPLFKQVSYANGTSKFLPIYSYPYKSICQSLERILMRPGLPKVMEHWRNRSVPDGYLCDIYDGAVWQENLSFFEKPHCYGLMLNLDWFQPFEHTNESIGAIYITIMNLPRTLRFKRENVILVCLIPYFEKEPPQVNTFIDPIVKELQKLNDGVKMFTSESPRYKITIKARLLCAACDIPASRKLCGFLGHQAHYGCSRCLKKFSGGFGSQDYSGFDRHNWPKRDIVIHRQRVETIKRAKSNQEKCKLESENGARYSALLELAYFNCIRFNVVDPMHNLFLGTAKRVMKIWRSRGLITDQNLQVIQTRINSVTVPPDVGRIPLKIASGFSNMTADQWKNWTVIYSLFALRDILPMDHFRCWEAFVMACRFLCCTVVTKESTKKADLLLVKFCKSIETLYGKNEITPNMHLHAHLSECVQDYGPIYSFWLFSFERYNGMLGDFPTNQKSIAVQVMRRFQNEQELVNITPPTDADSTLGLEESLQSLRSKKAHVTVLNETKLHNNVLLHAPLTQTWPENSLELCTLPSHKKIGTLTNQDMLVSTYTLMYSSSSIESTSMPRSVTFYTNCVVAGMRLGIKDNLRSLKMSHVLFAPITSTNPEREVIPAQIESIFTHRMKDNDGKHVSHCFATLCCYGEHPDRFKYGQSLQLWSRIHTSKIIIPVIRINSRFAPAYGTIKNSNNIHESVLFVCPLSRHLAL